MNNKDEDKFPMNQMAPEVKNIFNKMQIIPTMYISKGRSVISVNDAYKDQGDPFKQADFLSINSDMLLVDLDRKMNMGDNSHLIKLITSKYKCYLEGGITSIDVANEFLSSNIKRVVLTINEKELIRQINSNRIILKIKIDSDMNVKDLDSSSQVHLFDFLQTICDKINFISIYFHNKKSIEKKEMITIAKKIRQYLDTNELKIRTAINYSYDSVDEIRELSEMKIIPLFNNDFWNNISFGDIFSSIINYKKIKDSLNNDFILNHSLIVPVAVIKIEDNLPLGIVYTTKEGIKKSIDERKCYFYDTNEYQLIFPSKNNKSAHSNILMLHQVSFGCDRSQLLFVVSGGHFCNTTHYSCFNWHKAFNGGIKDFEKIILLSVKHGKDNSYTKKIASNKSLVLNKVIEEANEVWCASSSSLYNLKYEISDLVYFLTLFCVSFNIDVNLIYAELLRRHFALKPHYISKEISLTDFKLGLCISKYYQEHLFDFIKMNGIEITKTGKRFRAEFTSKKSITIKAFLIKPKDVYRFIENNLMDAVICFQDILDNYPCSYSQIVFPNKSDVTTSEFIISKICVIANKDFDIKLFKNDPLRKVVIFSEYNYLTSKWVDKMNITAKIVIVHGANEGHLVNRLCDLIVCVVSTGGTVRANNLVIIDTIYESSIGLYVKKGFEQEIQGLINEAKTNTILQYHDDNLQYIA